MDLPSGKIGAGVLRWQPNIKWEKDHGKEPQPTKDGFPWFRDWDGAAMDFMGGKYLVAIGGNSCHYSKGVKQAAREGGKEN